MEKRAGLILTGGGARAAYQVGVLKAIAEFLPRRAHNPFPVICGTSAGALNAAALAINARSFRKGVRYLDNIWKNFHADQVYRTDVVGVFNNTVLWLAGLVLIRLLLRLIGAVHQSGSTLVSYLLSEGKFCRALIDLGYQDALKRRDEILCFLDGQPHRDSEMPQ